MATESSASQLQVAGHPGGIISLDGGRKITKTTSKYEAEFYKLCNDSDDDDDALPGFRAFLPAFYGSEIGSSTSGKPDEATITIENLSHGFKHPNVLDVKLGKQLWDERASEEKRQRMDMNSKETTSWTEGLRLTGWQYWDNDSQETRMTSKTFGKAITPDLLPVGVRLFFGSASADDWAAYTNMVRDKEEISEHPPATLARKAIIKVLKDVIIPEVQKVERVFEKLEFRMRGGSFLFLYEGDRPTLEGALASSSPEALSSIAKVKLIDFAHARLSPGEGPDEGVLTGVRTFKKLVIDLLADLEQKDTA